MSYGPSYGLSNAWASPLCYDLAYAYGGYGFSVNLYYQAPPNQYIGTVGPMMNQGQCVTTLGQVLKGVSAYVQLI